MSKKNALVWFRLDLRLDDNPALHAALKGGGAVLPVFIWAPEEEAGWKPGGAVRYWLHQALSGLEASLEKAGSRLIIRSGSSLEVLQQLIRETQADAVFWNRRYEPELIRRDSAIKQALKEKGVQTETFNSAVLFEPWEVKTGSGTPFKVFTPFWNKCLTLDAPPEPLPAPAALPVPETWPKSQKLRQLGLEPAIDWAKGFGSTEDMTARGAEKFLKEFSAEAVAAYPEQRDLPAVRGTSRLSAYLHFGQISPRRVWHSLRKQGRTSAAYLRQLGWRDFAHHLLYHFPKTPDHPLREEYAAFPWKNDRASLKLWQRGLTGYPLVDAGMRELWKTGWMHNRVRMVTASFLVKHLLIPWQRGAEWFWDTLVDADLANNTLGWQWTAGCGADAAPYFRVFNPVSQGEKFDPDAVYIRRWIPELAAMPAKWIHRPWEAPDEILDAAGVRLGRTYPKPMVDHEFARRRTLAAYDEFKKQKPGAA